MTDEETALAVEISGGEVQGLVGNKEVHVGTIVINNYPKKAAPAVVEESHRPRLESNPYMGLAHFGPEDHKRFFGRSELTEKLKVAVIQQPFNALLGPSGSGKSSVALAGLAPSLAAEGNWLFGYFRVSDNSNNNPYHALTQSLITLYLPGANASQQLVEAKQLAVYLEEGKLNFGDICDAIRKNHPGKRLLLIADQFEELYTTGIAEKTQRRFVELLMQLGSSGGGSQQANVSVLLTMRADFLAQAASFGGFAELLDQHTHIVGPMKREQLRLAIVEPAKQQGVKFERGLVDTILDDIEIAHANLPLLEFALSELWDLQEQQTILLADYQNIGRVAGALTQRAQTIVEQLAPEEQRGAQRIFCQLVKLGQGTQDTRRIAQRSDFLPEDWDLVQRLASEQQRLIITNRCQDGEETAEVIHEVLIQSWPLLKQWINTDRTYLNWLEGVRKAEAQWREHRCDDGSLLRGVALHQACEWQATKGELIAPYIDDFIIISKQFSQREQRNKKMRMGIIAAAAMIFIVVLALLGLSLNSALQQTLEERNKQLISQSRYLASLSRQFFEQDNKRLSVLVAMAALPDFSKPESERRPFVPEAAVALYSNLGEYPERLVLKGDSKPLRFATYSDDGQMIITASTGSVVRLWNSQTGEARVLSESQQAELSHAAMSRDEKYLAMSYRDGTVQLQDAQTGELLFSTQAHGGPVHSVSFSNDSRALVSAAQNDVKIWTIPAGRQIHSNLTQSGALNYLEFNHDDSRILSASEDAKARLWDAQDGRELVALEGHKGAIVHATFSPDGTRVATGSADKTARIWDTNTGDTIAVLEGHLASVQHLAFSPDGQLLVSASADGDAKLWQSTDGGLLSTLQWHKGPVNYASFSPDGRKLVTASEDTFALLWDVDRGKMLAKLSGHTDGVKRASFSPDAQRLLTVADDGTARQWRVFDSSKELLEQFASLNLPPLTEQEKIDNYID